MPVDFVKDDGGSRLAELDAVNGLASDADLKGRSKNVLQNRQTYSPSHLFWSDPFCNISSSGAYRRRGAVKARDEELVSSVNARCCKRAQNSLSRKTMSAGEKEIYQDQMDRRRRVQKSERSMINSNTRAMVAVCKA